MDDMGRISKRKVSDFDLKTNKCIYCKEIFKDLTIYENDDHEEGCNWRYYLTCMSCGHKNYLAVLTEERECKCEDKP